MAPARPSINGAVIDVTKDATPSTAPPPSTPSTFKQWPQYAPPLPPAPMMDVATSSIWTHPVARNQYALQATPKWMEDVDISNPASPYYCYYVKQTPAELREAKQAQLEANGQSEPWYLDFWKPAPKEPEVKAPCTFVGGLAVPAMVSSKGFPGEASHRAAQAKATSDGIHYKSELQKKREAEQAEKQARRDRAIAAAEATKAGVVDDFEDMPPAPVKSATGVRAGQQDPTAQFINDITTALNPNNLQIWNKSATFKIPGKKIKAPTRVRKLVAGPQSGYTMTTIEENWAGAAGLQRTVNRGLDPLMKAISQVDKKCVRLLHVKHADGKFEGFLTGNDTNMEGASTANLMEVIMDCKEWLGKGDLGWDECLGLEEVNEVLQKYKPEEVVSSHFPMFEGRCDVFIYGQARTDVDTTATAAITPTTAMNTAGPMTPADPLSSDEDSSDFETEAPSQLPPSLKRKYAQIIDNMQPSKRPRVMDEVRSEKDDQQQKAGNRATAAQHTLPTPPLSKSGSPEPHKILQDKAGMPAALSNSSKKEQHQAGKEQTSAPLTNSTNPKTRKRKVVEDEYHEQERLKPQAKKSKPNEADDQIQAERKTVKPTVKRRKKAELTDDEAAAALALQEQLFKESLKNTAPNGPPVAVTNSATPVNNGEEVHAVQATGTRPKIRVKAAKKGGTATSIDLTGVKDDEPATENEGSKAPKKATKKRGRDEDATTDAADNDENAVVPGRRKKRSKRT